MFGLQTDESTLLKAAFKSKGCFYKDVLFFLYRHLDSGQPAKVLYLLTLGPAQRPAQDLKLVQSVTSQSVTLATVVKPVSEPVVPVGDPEKGSTELCVFAGSSEGQ